MEIHGIEENLIQNEIAAISEIYRSTFPLVGMEFLDGLMREITKQTKVNSAILLQLLTAEEYKDITEVYKEEEFHLISSSSLSSSSSPEIHHNTFADDLVLQQQHHHQQTLVNSISDILQDRFLLIRSCFSESSSLSKNTVIPISSLATNSPYLKALLNNKDSIISCTNNHTDIEEEEIERGIYPKYEQFLGLKLMEEKGILCVTMTTTTTTNTNSILNILNTVQLRCINELNQLQRHEKVTIARNIAVIDAENKLKFLADMSHEIRTPMNAVIALTDLLLQERATLNIEQIEHLEVIQTSGNHLLTIINDILDISKLNHDPKFKLECRRFSLRKCLKDTLNMARHQASMSQQNKVVYVLECPPDKDDNLPLPQLIDQLENKGILLMPLLNRKGKTVLPLIWKIDSDVPDHLLGDAMRLTQIMLNLCSNAIKFTKQGGIHIRIKRSTPTPLRPNATTRQSDKRMTFKERYDAKIETIWNQAIQDEKKRTAIYNPNLSPTASTAEDTENPDYFGEKAILEISVTDTGIGIPADRLPKLFKSFSQIDISTARRYGGTGLGLAISSTLVNRMGGCVWVESEEGVGSRFALTLPMTVAPRTRNYSSDSTPLGFIGSPSSPSSTISDSSGSVHSALGTSSIGSNSELVSPMYTFSSPAVNNAPSNPGYFPLTTVGNNSLFQQQQQNRPTLTRTTNQQLPASEVCHTRTEPPTPILPQMSQPSTTTNELFSPMAEDTHVMNHTQHVEDLKPTSMSSTMNGMLTTNSNSSSNNIRKSYNDLLSPASRSTRVGISKNYHSRKPQANKEENLAKAHPLRILLAEDNILNQKIAISILKRLGYVDVAIANNGREVLTLMKTNVFDVIFMDLYMPEMDGLEVTREIIKDRSRQKPNEEPNATNNSGVQVATLLNAVDVYIIALTASASREDRQICIDAGMNDFISKPFTMTEMKSALKTCVNKRKKRRKVAKIEDQPPPASSTTDDPMLDIQPNQIV